MKKKLPIMRIIVTVLLLLLLLCAGVVFFFWYMGRDEIDEEPLPEQTDSEPRDVDETEDYTLETCYDGSKELSPRLFAFPFQKDRYYVMNKELVKKVDEDRLQSIQDRATEIAEGMLTINGKDAVLSYYRHENDLADFFIDDCNYTDEAGEVMSKEEYIDSYLMLLEQSGLQADVKYTTDKSLVWQDDAYYVRGFVELTVYDIDEAIEIDSFFPCQLQKGKSYEAILDIGLIPDTSRKAETYRISSTEWIDFEELEENQTDAADLILVPQAN